jgi:hypothetical protein
MAALTCGHRRPYAQVILVSVITRIKWGRQRRHFPGVAFECISVGRR